MTDDANPLLQFDRLPAYDAIRPQHVGPAVERLLKDCDAALERVTAANFPAQWDAISLALDTVTERLSLAWGAVSHLNAVADSPELRAAYNESLSRVTEFWTRLGADERLYAKYRQIDAAGLTAEQRRAHSNAIRNFVLSGADLRGAAKERFAQIQARQAELSQKFSENALDATDGFALYVDRNELDGVPEDVLTAAEDAARKDGKPGCKLTLKLPSYLPVMQFAKNGGVREQLYRAYTTRASEFGDGRFDNTAIIREILSLRREEARLLGYANFAEVSLVPKMAQTPTQVVSFLRGLAGKARPFALRDVEDMRAFAAAELGIKEPQPWDWPFIAERLKEARFAFSEQEVKQYFTAPRVLHGLFKIVETLFEVEISRDSAPVWNPAVEFYRLERARSDGSRELVGQFYLDQPARTGKRGGAWMDDVRSRWLRPDTSEVQTPVATLVCNFAQGVNGNPPLLTHDDVITLFHEFGHGLHHMLTRVNEHDVSGISGVEWDAVELPSQFMENFCWEWNVLKHMTSHVETHEPLPRSLFDKMLAAKNFQSGLQTLRQVEFSLFDMLLHSAHDPDGDFMELLKAVRSEVAVMESPTYNRSPHTFSHIFAGGYAAGYYSYKWAEVLSADVYAAFEEAAAANSSEDPSTNRMIGRKYRESILEVGGSRPALESFKAFRGREPDIDALLRHQGMS